MPKANYPDWVLKYKSKGVYVNKKGDTYYLYRAHCVYDKSTGKNKRISDGYIGRVTKEDGFIPVRDKVKGDIFVYEFGMVFFLSSLLSDVYKSLKKNKRKDSIMTLAIMNYLQIDSYSSTALFHIYKKCDTSLFNQDDVINEANRVSSMLHHYVTTKIREEDYTALTKLLTTIHLVKVNDNYYISSICNDLKQLLDKYNIEVKLHG